MKNSEIKFQVQLDENHVPEKIDWQATDSSEEGIQTCNAVLISIWDAKQNNSLKIDLWTKDMTVDEMKKFFHQTLFTMADTFEKATGEDKIAGDMKDFTDYFAEKMGITNPKNN